MLAVCLSGASAALHVRRTRAPTGCRVARPRVWHGGGRSSIPAQCAGAEYQPSWGQAFRPGGSVEAGGRNRRAGRRQESPLQGDMGGRRGASAENLSGREPGGGATLSLGKGNTANPTGVYADTSSRAL